MRTICLLVLALAINVSRVDADKAKDDGDKDKKEMALLNGEWDNVSVTVNGYETAEEYVKNRKRTTKDGVTTIKVDGEVTMKAKFSIDVSKKIKTIDYEVIEGVHKDKKLLGIYEIDGDTLTNCFAASGRERPTEFEAPEGSKRTLSVWKKAEKK